MFLTYIHARPDGRIFYVGKGTSARVSKIDRHHNPHHSNIVAKYGRKNILVGKMECSSEEIAFELEKGLIKCLRPSRRPYPSTPAPVSVVQQVED